MIFKKLYSYLETIIKNQEDEKKLYQIISINLDNTQQSLDALYAELQNQIWGSK